MVDPKDSDGMREQLARHDERFGSMTRRFDTIDNAHGKLRDAVEEIRQKIFNGYDHSIKTTRDELSKVHDIVRSMRDEYIRHASEAHMDRDTVASIVKLVMSDIPKLTSEDVQRVVDMSISKCNVQTLRDRETESKWWKTHKLEILAGVGVAGALVSSLVAVLSSLGVL